ncbi:MAG: hypothetical protein ACRC46_08055 [Thermoguttaceae bacterium]
MNTSITETSRCDLSPELAAWEASLASFAPHVAPERLYAAKTAIILHACQKAEDLVPPLSGEKLIETIVTTDRQQITLSLREYVQSERRIASLFGIIVGLLLGLVIGVGSGFLLAMRPAAPFTTPFTPPAYRIGLDRELQIP